MDTTPLLRDDLSDLIDGRDGVMVVGDIHGHPKVLEELIGEARRDNLGIFLLGDLINRGPDSTTCMRLAIDAYDEGILDLIPGNHEQRLQLFFAWERCSIDGPPRQPLTPKDEDRMAMTIAEIHDSSESRKIAKRYMDLILSRPIWRLRESAKGRQLLVHGAAHPIMLERPGLTLAQGLRGENCLIDLAVDGERPAPEASENTYAWLDQMPDNLEIVIGHDPIARYVPGRRGAGGAQLVHLDAGCGRSPFIATRTYLTGLPFDQAETRIRDIGERHQGNDWVAAYVGSTPLKLKR